MPNLKKLREDVFARIPGLDIAEKLFESLEDTTFCVKDRDGHYVAANGAFVRRVQAAGKAAVLGRTARDFFPPLLAAGFERQDEIVFSTGGEMHNPMEMTPHVHGKAGGWYITHKTPLSDSRGEIVALAAISREIKTPAGDDPRLAALARVIDLIRRDYAKRLRMEDVARRAGMPLRRLERMMCALLRLSPRQFLSRTRIDAAAYALRNTPASLWEVAANCGFYDQSSFSRQFREATGFTPGQYREAGGARAMKQ